MVAKMVVRNWFCMGFEVDDIVWFLRVGVIRNEFLFPDFSTTWPNYFHTLLSLPWPHYNLWKDLLIYVMCMIKSGGNLARLGKFKVELLHFLLSLSDIFITLKYFGEEWLNTFTWVVLESWDLTCLTSMICAMMICD